MTKLLVCLLFSLLSVSGFSQKIYFVYLQTENEQPFYVRMDKTVHSSSASGYLILSKLKDSTYNLHIGFPQNKWPEQKFTVTIGRKDHGFIVKNFGEKGWGLFDLQTLVVQMSSGGSAKLDRPGDDKDASAFTNILAKAANDPSLRETIALSVTEEKGTGTSIKENEKKGTASETIDKPNVTEKAVHTKETVAVKKEESKTEEIQAPKELVQKTGPVIVQTESKEQPLSKQEESISTEVNYKPSTVIKRSEASMTEGLGLVFIDKNDKGINDTISLIIPNPKPIVTPKEDSNKEEKKFLELLPDTVTAEEKTVVKTEPQKFYREMNNCPSLARDNDFFKLRKLMAASEGDDNMIAEAKEYFKLKCFSTQQIKNLGTLFLTDAGKYKFFEIAYNHVVDKNSFDSLQTEIKDEQYISLFKAMTRN